MRQELKEILDKMWFDKLQNKDVPNKKLLIVFSDIPGSGLTEDLSKEIAEKYKGVWVPKDQARTLIYENEKIESTEQAEDILDEYMDDVLDRLIQLPNGLLVIDAGVDRKYEFYRDWAKLNDYEMYVIGFIVNRDKVLERVKKDRDENTTEWFRQHLDSWFRDQEKFNDLYGANFYVRDKNLEQETELFKELDSLIS